MRLPRWELEGWKHVFRVFGPLDWTRDDWKDAREIASRCAERGEKLDDYLMFAPPRREQTTDEMLRIIEG